FGIHPDFTLGDDAISMRMHELYRILDGDDMAVAVFIAMANHGCQRGGLARTRCTDQDDQAAFTQRHIFQDFGYTQFINGGNLAVDGTQHHAYPALLDKCRDTEATETGRRDREITLL